MTTFTWVHIFPAFLAILLHEAGHAYAAKWMGDPTADKAGRCTLNPLKHFDFWGTLIMPSLALTLTGIPIGWAKSVPVVAGFMRPPVHRSLALVACAGAIANVIMAAAWALLFIASVVLIGWVWGVNLREGAAELWMSMCYGGVWINIVFALFNMIPIPPLDGGIALRAVMPDCSVKRAMYRYEPYGLIFVLLMLIAVSLFFY